MRTLCFSFIIGPTNYANNKKKVPSCSCSQASFSASEYSIRLDVNKHQIVSSDKSSRNSYSYNSRKGGIREDPLLGGGGAGDVVVAADRKQVRCEVEVVSWRERRIKAEIPVNADVNSVWNALTDYERLADFVPNLVSR